MRHAHTHTHVCAYVCICVHVRCMCVCVLYLHFTFSKCLHVLLSVSVCLWTQVSVCICLCGRSQTLDNTTLSTIPSFKLGSHPSRTLHFWCLWHEWSHLRLQAAGTVTPLWTGALCWLTCTSVEGRQGG